jgi:metal-dependent hydrolase (beta-lactamase superfamily II)
MTRDFSRATALHNLDVLGLRITDLRAIVLSHGHGDHHGGLAGVVARVGRPELERLFRPFERLEPRHRHYETGHGLGLSIVEAIATAHGAAITARSRPAGGLAVEVVFPSPADIVFDADTTADGISEGQNMEQGQESERRLLHRHRKNGRRSITKVQRKQEPASAGAT